MTLVVTPSEVNIPFRVTEVAVTLLAALVVTEGAAANPDVAKVRSSPYVVPSPTALALK
jgi:hypothetical protein